MSIQNDKNGEKFSQLRLTLIQCAEEIFSLVKSNHILSKKPVIKGSVYELKRKCSKPGCKCTKGRLHTSMVLSSSEAGRTKLQVIPSGYLVEVRTKVRRYQSLRRGRARLGELHTTMLQIIDEMASLRREELPSVKGSARKQGS